MSHNLHDSDENGWHIWCTQLTQYIPPTMPCNPLFKISHFPQVPLNFASNKSQYDNAIDFLINLIAMIIGHWWQQFTTCIWVSQTCLDSNFESNPDLTSGQVILVCKSVAGMFQSWSGRIHSPCNTTRGTWWWWWGGGEVVFIGPVTLHRAHWHQQAVFSLCSVIPIQFLPTCHTTLVSPLHESPQNVTNHTVYILVSVSDIFFCKTGEVDIRHIQCNCLKM